VRAESYSTREVSGCRSLREAEDQPVRVYHFIPAKYALEDIEKRRIKISEIDQLNDPFELWCVSQKDKRLRVALRGYKNKMSANYGLLCFSERWDNPVLWSHYADKHRGICLGFEIDEQRLQAISYVNKRPTLRIPPNLEDANKLLFTKYRDWKYEEEWRSWIKIDERDPATGFYFYPFDGIVELSEVIVGPLCNISKTKIDKALKGNPGKVNIIKARLAFKTFRVVKNVQGF
jgi:Protein of unknown function (DUF2971)